MNRREYLLAGLLQKVRRLLIADLMRHRLEYFKRDLRFQVVLGLWD